MIDYSVLDHATRLKIFLIMRREPTRHVSIRELQKKVGVGSTSTIIWHFEKMMEGGILDKNKQNLYYLTKEAIDEKQLSVPVNLPVQLIRGELVPKRLLLLTFLISSIVVGTVFWIVDPLLSLVFLMGALVTTTVTILWEYVTMTREIKQYLDLENDRY